MHRAVTTGAIALWLVASPASAIEFGLDDTGEEWFPTPSGGAALNITQNHETVVIHTNAVSCGAGDLATANTQYLRRFYLTVDHNVVDPFTVESVDVGIQQVRDGTPDPVAVEAGLNVYAIPHGDALLYANLTLLATSSFEVSSADEGTLIEVPIEAVIDNPATTDLVVEVVADDFRPDGIRFRVGANLDGAIHDAYVASIPCGVEEPITVTAIGFPDSQFIFIVNGEEAATTPNAEVTWTEVKSLF